MTTFAHPRPTALLLLLFLSLVSVDRAVSTTAASPPAASLPASTTVDIGFFYNRLAPYGTWFQLAPYGWVWHPTDVALDWRPYTYGRWLLTDEYGWYWDADEDWGWACFHYGRWDWADDWGWFWVPGYEWGPAWVAWRTGGGFIGWAPLPPDVVWEAGGLRFPHRDRDDRVLRTRWAFVDEQDFLSPRIHEELLERGRNVTLLEQTKDATHYGFENNRITNRGIAVSQVERSTGKRVEPLHVRDVDHSSAALGRHLAPGTVNVFHPEVRRSNRNFAPPSAADASQIREAQQQMLQERHREEADRMTARHRAELERHDGNEMQLRRQQEAERQSMLEQQRREMHVFQNRPPQAPSHGRPPGHGG